ncbi:MAG: hypothetical protein JXK08_09990 [Flavobacteriaceae bacterium]|nr:hypothetical protein [Flavobacteriaceae bacterium]
MDKRLNDFIKPLQLILDYKMSEEEEVFYYKEMVEAFENYLFYRPKKEIYNLQILVEEFKKSSNDYAVFKELKPKIREKLIECFKSYAVLEEDKRKIKAKQQARKYLSCYGEVVPIGIS